MPDAEDRDFRTRPLSRDTPVPVARILRYLDAVDSGANPDKLVVTALQLRPVKKLGPGERPDPDRWTFTFTATRRAAVR